MGGHFRFPWFTRADYSEMRALMGQHCLPESFAQWELAAMAMQRQIEAQGATVQRVNVDPHKFDSWCRRSDKRPDDVALAEFVKIGGRSDAGPRGPASPANR
jgi:hypothetical protein